ncbi:GHKL domain-containing protein [Chryseobacterium balustinum]|uniref:GHKL domain-containing protein n=2 Tax=Chryseobacterium balustinum TaxID=246 RepID=A0AAX2ILF1_9FLAO|nr:GHKL domain-containing protein [Chryseobacterium balustinum]SQA90090.1 Inner membrane protein ypdA [Chryseobacterium balustinum]
MILKKNNKWIVIALLLMAIVPVIITVYEVIFKGDKSVMFLGNYHPNVVFLVVFYYLFLFGLGVFWLVRQIIFISKLKNEKTKAELMLLKSQVSPHFFFNMLNNLYGLVAKDPQKAQGLILKLSDMMRYSIYEGEKETVKIQEEIDFLKNYVELHKMRYHKLISVDFHCNIDKNLKVAPLLFIILLENAFKHGVENLRENAYIKISLATSKNEIFFSIENNFEKTENQYGIGLKNLKRRLELIYPNQHELTFSETENVYQAQLILKQL